MNEPIISEISSLILQLLLAGIMGLCFCCINITMATDSGKGCFIKAMCFILSIIAIFVNVIACVFPGVHLGRIYTYITCRFNVSRCECYNSNYRIFLYDYVEGCDIVFWEVKLYLFVMGGLCLLGSIISLWFVILLWSQRYGGFYSGTTDTPVLRRRNLNFDVAKLPPEA